MLRVTDHAHRSDTGRQRRANEDSYFARPPLFVVADGMGGARAGEVASGLAVQGFEEGLPGQPGAPEERLAGEVQAANRRIHELSRRNVDRAGMGTTITAAYVDAEEVAIAHVGDSRAYRLRDGALERLTDDHSLVDELRRQGRLTEAEAAEHPQRSIITRALGPEASVEVDTRTHRARAGDVYLLCTDGLTSMISEDRVHEVLMGAPSLERAARELVAGANQAGGKDNITVVLFALEEVDGAATPVTTAAPGASTEPGGDTGEQPTMVGDTGAGAAVRAGLASGATTALAPPTVASRSAAPRRAEATATRKRRRPRWWAGVLALLAVAVLIVAAAWVATQSVYFIATDASGLVAVYRGVPYDLPLGIRLYTPNFVSGVNADTISPGRRRRLLDHKLRSHDDASGLVRALEQGRLYGTRASAP